VRYCGWKSVVLISAPLSVVRVVEGGEMRGEVEERGEDEGANPI
jgi:hypothetical protein